MKKKDRIKLELEEWLNYCGANCLYCSHGTPVVINPEDQFILMCKCGLDGLCRRSSYGCPDFELSNIEIAMEGKKWKY